MNRTVDYYKGAPYKKRLSVILKESRLIISLNLNENILLLVSRVNAVGKRVRQMKLYLLSLISYFN